MSEPRSGLVIVDKPGGLTSHDVVARVRRLAGTRKVGHAGTLDPMATGVLVIGVNRATRLLGHLMLTEKSYDATIRLGAATTTDDAEGDVVSRADASGVTEARIRTALAAFVGEIEQRPSSVSAIKVDGRRAHERVRAGEDVQLASRLVTVHELVVHDVRSGGGSVDIDVSVRCSSGTYIRALARDLGQELGVGGHLTVLRRTAVGRFGLGQAHTLDELGDHPPDALPLVDLSAAARQTFPVRELTEEQAADVRVGRRLEADLGAAGPVAVFAPTGGFLALYEQRGPLALPVAVFTG